MAWFIPTTRGGKIDHKAADYMREHSYDLWDYMERNWPETKRN
jgi:hypothetical protein